MGKRFLAGITAGLLIASLGAPSPALADERTISDDSDAASSSPQPPQPYYWAVDPDGTDRRPLHLIQSADEESWSPDGTRLAYGAHEEVRVFDIESGESTRLVHVETRAYPGGPIWSPDGTKVAFTANTTGSDDIFVVNADGSDLRTLTSSPEDDYSPTWSPDSASIAYISGHYEGSTGRLWIIDLEGNARQVGEVQTAYQRPEWSPTGDRIAFWGGSERTDLSVTSLDGTNVVRLHDGYVPYFDWTPDGTRIVCDCGNLTEIDVTSGERRELLAGRASPDHSPIDERIVVSYGSEIQILHPDGSLQPLTDTPDDDTFHPVWAPDGSRIAYATARVQSEPPPIPMYDSLLSIRYSSRHETFRGSVTSSVALCERRRMVKLRRWTGEDWNVIARDATTRDGRWSIPRGNARGRYSARVAEKSYYSSKGSYRCEGDVSRTIWVP